MNSKSLAIALVLLFGAVTIQADELVTLDTRPNVEQKFILIEADEPKASLVMFPGGTGVLELSSFFGSPKINSGKNNFLVRTRDMFAKQGFSVALVDAPSDQMKDRGMLGGFRDSAAHVEDIDQVIRYMRERSDAPLWLLATSRGTESAANVAMRSKERADGLVLISSMSVPNSDGVALAEMDLSGITVPTLIVAHTQDACPETPPEGAEEIARLLTGSEKVELKTFSGGKPEGEQACQGSAYHGFFGIDDEVVAYVTKFIESN